MDLKAEVLNIMRCSDKALTVDQVAQRVAENIKEEIRSVLNALDKDGELESVHGGGGYQTHYKATPIKRRV